MDLSGEGARLHGGRRNHIGMSCLYTSQSRSLTVLELSVNVSATSVLRYLSMVEIGIPNDVLESDIVHCLETGRKLHHSCATVVDPSWMPNTPNSWKRIRLDTMGDLSTHKLPLSPGLS